MRRANVSGLAIFVVGLVIAPSVVDAADDPVFATYQQSLQRMAQPDETFATVSLTPTAGVTQMYLASSKTCSQRCSTRCSVSCTTTRGCSSQCKKQTDGCGGTSEGSSGTSTSDGRKKKKPADTEIVDINGASRAELEAIPGIDSDAASKIISGRPWNRKDELVKAGVLTQAAYDKVKAWIIAKQE